MSSKPDTEEGLRKMPRPDLATMRAAAQLRQIGRVFVDEAFAAWVHRAVIQWYVQVQGSVDRLEAMLDPEQHDAYCRASGSVLALTLHMILAPIYNHHPRLAPPGMRIDPELLLELPKPLLRKLSPPAPPGTPPAVETMEVRQGTLFLVDVVALNLRDIASLASLQFDAPTAGVLAQGMWEILREVDRWRQLTRELLASPAAQEG